MQYRFNIVVQRMCQRDVSSSGRLGSSSQELVSLIPQACFIGRFTVTAFLDNPNPQLFRQIDHKLSIGRGFFPTRAMVEVGGDQKTLVVSAGVLLQFVQGTQKTDAIGATTAANNDSQVTPFSDRPRLLNRRQHPCPSRRIALGLAWILITARREFDRFRRFRHDRCRRRGRNGWIC